MTKTEREQWLEATAWNKIYWSEIRTWANNLKSDGCTGVADWMVWACLEHDCHYRMHHDLKGNVLTKAEADYIFRVRMQQGSALGVLSPISWWRWAAVSVLGRKAWNHDG